MTILQNPISGVKQAHFLLARPSSKTRLGYNDSEVLCFNIEDNESHSLYHEAKQQYMDEMILSWDRKMMRMKTGSHLSTLARKCTYILAPGIDIYTIEYPVQMYPVTVVFDQ